jgi:hypothetical protein
MTFNEANVRRQTDGRFDNKVGSQPEVALFQKPADEITYHRDIGIPSNVTVPQREIFCEYTGHADRERENDRYNYIPKLDKVDLRECQVIEVSVSGGRVSKLLVRVPHPSSNQDDIVMVMRPGEHKKQPWTIVTNWVNRRSDKHRTLDRSKYADPAAA